MNRINRNRRRSSGVRQNFPADFSTRINLERTKQFVVSVAADAALLGHNEQSSILSNVRLGFSCMLKNFFLVSVS